MKKRIRQFNIRKWTERQDSKRAKIIKNSIFFAKHPLTWLLLCIIIAYGFDL